MKEEGEERGGIRGGGQEGGGGKGGGGRGVKPQELKGDGSAQTILRAAILSQKPQIKLSTTPSQFSDTGPTSPRADPITPGAWQGSHWSGNFSISGYNSTRKNPVALLVYFYFTHASMNTVY